MQSQSSDTAATSTDVQAVTEPTNDSESRAEQPGTEPAERHTTSSGAGAIAERPAGEVEVKLDTVGSETLSEKQQEEVVGGAEKALKDSEQPPPPEKEPTAEGVEAATTVTTTPTGMMWYTLDHGYILVNVQPFTEGQAFASETAVHVMKS